MFNERAWIAVLMTLVVGLASADAQPVPAPWRRDDATLLSLCFDGLGKEAPEKITALEITDISVGTAAFELIGHTTTGRPKYEAKLAHPMRFRSILVDLPGGSTLRFDRPENLPDAIEGWVYSSSSTQCVDDAGLDRFGVARAVLAGAVLPTSKCPEIGSNISYRVDNGPGYGSRRILERQRGLNVLNGLRGCREFVYK